jgi:2-polyprenyl-3-methyl-5-hydroxy-6-metoxy-1,4-benzoquinol methylase
MQTIPTPEKCYICESSQVRFFKNKHRFNIFKCTVCQLSWVGDQIDQKQLEELYDETYYNSDNNIGYKNYLAGEANHRLNAQEIIREFEFFQNLHKAKVLDIGCAAGFFLDELKNSRQCEVYGVEGSAYAYQHAKQLLGSNVLNQMMDSTIFEPDLFDVVFLIGTIEHLADPRGILKDIYRVLKPGGYLGITTIDAKGLIPLYSLKPPEHLFYFDHNNLALLLKQYNFKMTFQKTHFSHYHLYDLFHRLKEFSSFPPLGTLSKIIQKYFPEKSIKIPTNEMLIIGEKTPV